MKRSTRLALALSLLFLVLFPLAVEEVPPARLVDHFRTFVTVFLGIFIEAMPFLLAGTLASGLIESFVRQEWVQNLSPRSPILGGVMGALLGFVFPVCECGVVPVTRRLVRKGLPLPVAIAYMLAAPVIHPIVIASTWTAFGWSVVLWMRMALMLVVAVVVGCVFALSRDPSRVLLPEQAVAPTCCDHRDEEFPETKDSSKPSWSRRIVEALLLSGDEFFEMGRYLILGSLLAAGMQTLVPQAVLLGIGHIPATSVLVMMALAFALSICSTVDAFMALTFTRTFTTAAILAFLVFGPMVDIKSLLMFLGVFRRRAAAYLVLLPLAMVLFAALSFNLLVGW